MPHLAMTPAEAAGLSPMHPATWEQVKRWWIAREDQARRLGHHDHDVLAHDAQAIVRHVALHGLG
jgi:hypothetical protein